jgi:hypothetical protein
MEMKRCKRVSFHSRPVFSFCNDQAEIGNTWASNNLQQIYPHKVKTGCEDANWVEMVKTGSAGELL